MTPNPTPPRKRVGIGTPAREISTGGILHHDFRGESWARWRAILKAAFGEPLTPEELALFREVADRDPPTRRVRELWIVAGRRAGKDSIASAIATVAALNDYSQYLRTGERATVMCLAVNREQAGIVHGYISGYFSNLPMLKPLVEKENDELLRLRNGVDVLITTNSFRVVRGRTVAIAIFDEVAYWRSTESAVPDQEIYNAVEGGMLSIPTAMMIGISSPYKRSGLLYQKWAQHYGKNDDDVLVIRAPSRTLNPTLPQRIIDRRLAEDPEAGAAEYLAEWRDDISGFLDEKLIEDSIDRGITIRPPQPDIEYAMVIDPSGGRGDAFACAIGHLEDSKIIVDCLFQRNSPFVPSEVIEQIGELARRYRIVRVRSDKYGEPFVADGLDKVGLSLEVSQRTQSDVYLAALRSFAEGSVKLPDDRQLAYQLASLQRRSTPTGKDVVDHRRGEHDDLAACTCGLVTLLGERARPALIRHEAMLTDGKPVSMPKYGRSVYATLVVGADGLAAVAYFAEHGLNRVTEPAPLTLIDATLSPLTSSTVTDMFTRLEELHRLIPGIWYHNAYVPEAYLQHVHLEGYVADAWDKRWLHDLPGLAMGAAGHVHRGQFKIAESAASRGLPLGGAMTFRAGEKIDDDPLKLAILIGIRLGLTDESSVSAPVLPMAQIVLA